MEAPTIRRLYSPYEGREPVGFASGPGCAASAPALGAVGRALHDVRKRGARHGVPFQGHTPRPRKTVLEDGTEVIRTCAWSPPGCHAVGCGIRLFVKDGELVKVEGDPDHQLTQGALCPRGAWPSRRPCTTPTASATP